MSETTIQHHANFKRLHKRLKKLNRIKDYSKEDSFNTFVEFLTLGGDPESDDFISFYILLNQTRKEATHTIFYLYQYFEETYIGIHPSKQIALVMWLDFISDLMDLTPYIDFDRLYKDSPLTSHDIDGYFRCYFTESLESFDKRQNNISSNLE